MTTLTPQSARRLALAYQSALVFESALKLLGMPSGEEPLLPAHAENMMPDTSGLVAKLKRLMDVTETDFFPPLPEYDEFSGPERPLKFRVDELVFLVKQPST